MVHRIRLGAWGEEVATKALAEAGWAVLERRYRFGHREIDIVAEKGDVVAFIEVKTRRTVTYGHPFESITRTKRRDLEVVARRWIRDHPNRGRVHRFDVISVTLDRKREVRVEHLENAWSCERRPAHLGRLPFG